MQGTKSICKAVAAYAVVENLHAGGFVDVRAGVWQSGFSCHGFYSILCSIVKVGCGSGLRGGGRGGVACGYETMCIIVALELQYRGIGPWDDCLLLASVME